MTFTCHCFPKPRKLTVSATRRVRCPLSGLPDDCPECRLTVPHRREELIRDGDPLPTCALHNLQMVDA